MPTPLRPKATVLQTAAVADLLLSHIHLLLGGVLFLDDQASACAYYREGCFQTPISALVGRAGIEPAVPRLKVVCLTTRLPAHIFGGSSLIRTGNCEFCRLPSYRLTKEPSGRFFFATDKQILD